MTKDIKTSAHYSNGHSSLPSNGTSDHTIDAPSGVNGHLANTNGHDNGAFVGETNGHNSNGDVNLHRCNNETPVAICGMAMRLPGGIRNERELYDFLLRKGDARSVVPEDRYSNAGYYSADGRYGTVNTQQGYFLKNIDYSKFDLSMFSFNAAEAEHLDPNHRLVLEVVREAFENAGEAEWRSKNIGTYSGLFTEDWQEMNHRDSQDYSAHRVLGGTDFALPNRVAYEYDLKGPSMVIKTACSSAGIALHEALEAIREEKISAAIITGSNLILAPGLNISLTLLGSLSPEGSSKSFDASADGYARGEAVSALYIKRLDQAIQDGNPIRAVIRASATNADGKSNGMTMPDGEAHERLIRQAYDSIGLKMSDTAMIEAHGTGTKVGDPIEVNAIGRCWGEHGILIGASKPNLGHSEGAAALTGVIKAVMSLENRTILPNIKFNNPNPRIPWDDLKLTVPTEAMPWPENKAERMSVNSYGIGGSNVHFVIDSAASFGIRKPSAGSKLESTKRPRKALLLFSANHEDSLRRVSENINDYLSINPDCVEDVAHTLATRREHMKFRNFSIFTDASQAFQVSPRTKHAGVSEVAFVFTGQGAQWVHMGRELMIDYPAFLHDIRSMDKVLQSLRHVPAWSIEDVLANLDDGNLLLEPELSQPLCTALQIALVNLLASWGIKPSAVVGHSSGELAAAYAAGALSAKDAVIAAFYRGQICKSAHKSGGMAAVGLGREDVLSHLIPGVRIACENSGSSVTISGDLEAVEHVMVKIKESRPDVLCRKLQVKAAYHSHHMALVGDEYRSLIGEHLSPSMPNIPFYSSVRAKVLRNAADFDQKYWQENLESPVLFHSAVKLLLAGSKECAVHLEVGPHAALAGPLRQIYKEDSDKTTYVSVLSRGVDDTTSFLSAIGQLHGLGVKITFPHSKGKVLTDLPNYPWHYEKSYWSETRIQKTWRFRKHLPHDLLGLRILESSDLAPAWRNVLKTVNVPWLNDHCVGDDTIFPAAGYLAMAGEAVFQIDGTRDYTVREIEISKALVLYNDKSVELITNLAPQRNESFAGIQWYTFQIISYDGNTWNTHCSGLVRSGRASALPEKKSHSLDRAVSSSRWYTTLSRVGLNYSGRFARLSNMAASVVECFASAEVLDERDVGESSYGVHPSTLDMIFQSLTIAKTRGIYRDFNTLFLPTYIEELYVGEAAGKAITINTSATGESGVVQGNSYGLADGGFVFALRGFQGTSMRKGEEPSLTNTTLQLQWKPHPKYLEAGTLLHLKKDFRNVIQISERLAVLCAIETRNAIQGLTAAQPHLNKYRDWLNAEYERYQRPGYPLVEDSADLVKMDPIMRRQLIEKVRKQTEEAGVWAAANGTYRAYANAAAVFEGKVNYLDILLQDGVLTGIYSEYHDIWDFKDYMQLHGHAKPQMKILEIGAGTGGLTSKFLEHLRSDFDERLYLKYTFTDISSGFFVQAKERFKDYEAIEYRALDISKDPLEQGFNPGEYDLIIAANVLHATPILQDTLTNVRTLLKPDGQLFMQELCPVTRSMQYVIGAFEGWWLQSDGRDTPFIEPSEWDKRLRDAGFSGCDSVTVDYEKPYTYMAYIVAKPMMEEAVQQKVTLLQGIKKSSFVAKVEEALRTQGIGYDTVTWGQDPLPVDQDIISFIDLGGRILLQDIDKEELGTFTRLIDDFQGSNLLWLMPPAQNRCTDPYAGQMVGLLRTVRSELAASFATLELEDTGEGASGAVVDVLKAIRDSGNTDDNLDADMEWIWSNGALNVGRFHWVQLEDDLCATAKTNDSKALSMRTPGILNSLEWISQSLDVLAPEDVHIRVTAAGLSHYDLRRAFETNTGGRGIFGLEAVGFITKLGANVNSLALGDRVMTLGSESAGLATVIKRSSQVVVKVPNRMSNEEAATLLIPYITVLVFLVERWKLEFGQSILIHNAAGSIGIAAINVAKWIGAEIYVTAGTEEEISFLSREQNIPQDHIFSSQNSSFLEAIMAVTNGAGVNLVLHTASSDLLSTSWKCVASEGALVDSTGKGHLTLASGDNRTFFGGDLTGFLISSKANVARLLELLTDLYGKNHVKAVSPIRAFDANDIEEAFKHLSHGESHIGSVAVTFPKEDTLPVAPVVPTLEFNGNATYVLIGGLGGLGKAIAQWMAQRGAQNLMFLSRSAGKSQEDQDFFRELDLMHCSVQYFAVDVANAKELKTALSQATRPIAGALHMPLVLADRGFFDMDHETWNKPIIPKVTGAWNLHDLLPKDMDFLVLFSSIGGTYGYYGQSNYAAANTFLDSFSQYRRGLGLPASVMSIGPIDDVGLVARNLSARSGLVHNMGNLLTESYFLDTLQLAITRSSANYSSNLKTHDDSSGRSYVASSHIFHWSDSATPIEDPENSMMWKRDPRMSIYRNIQKVSSSENSSTASYLKQFLQSVSKEPSKLDQKASVDFIATEIGSCIANFLGSDGVDLSLPVSAAGVDSLVAIEIRNWWKTNFGVDISVLELLSGGTIQQLGETAAQRLKAKYTRN